MGGGGQGFPLRCVHALSAHGTFRFIVEHDFLQPLLLRDPVIQLYNFPFRATNDISALTNHQRIRSEPELRCSTFCMTSKSVFVI